jgi:hypothetical protein
MLRTVALAPFLATLTAMQTAAELAPAAVDALRDVRRLETIAVGGLSFVDKVKKWTSVQSVASRSRGGKRDVYTTGSRRSLRRRFWQQ